MQGRGLTPFVNYRTNNGVLSTFVVDGKNQLTNAFSAPLVYDNNGNLTGYNNTRKDYVYDDENRMIQWFSYANGSSSPSSGDKRTDFAYDGLGRLRKRVEYSMVCTTNSQSPQAGGGGGGTSSCNWVLQTTTEYAYDGNRVIQERDGNNIPTVSYTHGNDLSGSLEGAGGIGGMLARSSGYSSGNWTTHTYYHADANGNITYLETSAEGLGASYRYDPFGNLISSSGSFSGVNTYRFSSREFHANSGMYYYLYRFYDPSLQRWLNRDPHFEAGGVNLYQFAHNNAFNFVDLLGLDDLNLFAPNSIDSKAANARGTTPSEITVGGHGTQQAVVDSRDGKDKPMSDRDLADAVKKVKGYNPKTPVRLYNCEAAKGNNSPAQRLSKLIPNPVIGSTEKTSETIYRDLSGNVTRSDKPQPINGGTWKKFQGGEPK